MSYLTLSISTVVRNLGVINLGEERLYFCDIFACKAVREPIIVGSSCFFNLGGKVMKNSILRGLLSLFDRLVCSNPIILI